MTVQHAETCSLPASLPVDEEERRELVHVSHCKTCHTLHHAATTLQRAHCPPHCPSMRRKDVSSFATRSSLGDRVILSAFSFTDFLSTDRYTVSRDIP